MADGRLDATEIVNSAGYATGHFKGLDAGFTGRLGNFTAWLNAHGGLTPDQELLARGQLLRIVITRLLLAVDRVRIPAIAAERIERPIFVMGYSRTGTTLMHSLLSLDPNHQAPRWWHSHQPSPPPGEMPVAKGRIEAARREMERWNECTPGLLAMHPYWDEGVDALIEDEEIHTLDLQNVYPTLLFRIPALATMSTTGTNDPRGCYVFQKQFLQHLQWNLPRRHWVSKGCNHQFNLVALFAEFPDALCVWLHRDPVEVHRSTLAIISVLYHAITHGRTDWKQYAAGYIEATRAAIDQVLADPLVDDPRIVHLRFTDVARNPMAAIKDIYAKYDKPCTADFEQRMRAWLDDPGHKPDRYGRYPYSLEPFGLEAEEVARAFAAYSRRFGLA